MNKFKIADIDQGFCRITYKTKNNEGENIYYCLMAGAGYLIELYRCTDDGEPDYPCTLKIKASTCFELPKGDTDLEKTCINWITKN